jgi:WD40 repeat protein
LYVLRGHGGTVFDASFSPNGQWVVTAGPATAGLWDARTGERIYFLQGHKGPLRAAAFSGPTLIVTRGADGVRSFDCDTCGDLAALRELAEERLEATGRTLSPAERRLYLGG